MLLQNKTAVVTGCKRGIGKTIIETFAKNGANIWACTRKPDNDFSKYLIGGQSRIDIILYNLMNIILDTNKLSFTIFKKKIITVFLFILLMIADPKVTTILLISVGFFYSIIFYKLKEKISTYGSYNPKYSQKYIVLKFKT